MTKVRHPRLPEGLFEPLASRVAIGFATVVSLLALLLLAGAMRNDFLISGDLGKAQAEVLSAGHFRSAIAFRTSDGATQNPTLGVLYPTNLTSGQRINVEYARSSPDLVRVAGRDSRVAILPVVSVIVVTTAIAGAVVAGIYVMRRRKEFV